MCVYAHNADPNTRPMPPPPPTKNPTPTQAARQQERQRLAERVNWGSLLGSYRLTGDSVTDLELAPSAVFGEVGGGIHKCVSYIDVYKCQGVFWEVGVAIYSMCMYITANTTTTP